MSDRTYAQVVVYDCPEDQRRAVLAAIFEGFGSEDLNEGATERLMLGERYGGDQCAGDLSETIAALIIDAAPDATFRAWTDPAYEWLGSLVMYAPELGEFRGECDSYGVAQWTARELTALLAKNGPGAALHRALGAAHDDAIAAALDRLNAGFHERHTEPTPGCARCHAA